MYVYLGADHRGFQLKRTIASWLISQKIEFTDFGADGFDPEDDYNDYAKKVAQAVQSNPDDAVFGILICGSAQGMAMQANRYKGVRAAICHSASEAIETRGHNDANVLCISADNDSINFAQIVDAFLDHPALTDERFLRRKQKLDEI